MISIKEEKRYGLNFEQDSFFHKENFLTMHAKERNTEQHKGIVESVLLEFFRKHLDEYLSDVIQISWSCRFADDFEVTFTPFFFLCESSGDITVWSCQVNMCQLHFSKAWNVIKHGWIVMGFPKRYHRHNAPTPHQIQAFTLKYGVSLTWVKLTHISLISKETAEVFWLKLSSKIFRMR